MDEDVYGRCHLRGVPRAEATCAPTTKITYCPACDHWFCESCKHRWWERGLEYVKELAGGKTDGCCGPREAAYAGSQREAAQVHGS